MRIFLSIPGAFYIAIAPPRSHLQGEIAVVHYLISEVRPLLCISSVLRSDIWAFLGLSALWSHLWGQTFVVYSWGFLHQNLTSEVRLSLCIPGDFCTRISKGSLVCVCMCVCACPCVCVCVCVCAFCTRISPLRSDFRCVFLGISTSQSHFQGQTNCCTLSHF